MDRGTLKRFGTDIIRYILIGVGMGAAEFIRGYVEGAPDAVSRRLAVFLAIGSFLFFLLFALFVSYGWTTLTPAAVRTVGLGRLRVVPWSDIVAVEPRTNGRRGKASRVFIAVRTVDAKFFTLPGTMAVSADRAEFVDRLAAVTRYWQHIRPAFGPLPTNPVTPGQDVSID